jgi:hypothetical protein
MKRFALLCLILTSSLLLAGTATLPSAKVYYLATGSPSSGTNEVQTITFGSGQVSGNFYLRFNNSTTPVIAWSSTNATLVSNIDSALESLAKIGTGGVTTAVGTMTAGIGTITVTFTGINAHADVVEMTVPSKTTSGTIVVTTTTPGVAADGRTAANGSLLVIGDTGAVYLNTGASPSPVWQQIFASEVAFASLPSSPTVGMLANVSDSNTATWGANISGSGSNHVQGRWNGSNWTVVGK